MYYPSRHSDMSNEIKTMNKFIFLVLLPVVASQIVWMAVVRCQPLKMLYSVLYAFCCFVRFFLSLSLNLSIRAGAAHLH